MPLFSIVIPTRARADTLAHTLRTVLNQRYRNIEIVVHESGADAKTAALMTRISDPRVRFYSTGEPVPMTVNWERALDRATGDYVFFMGDDDGLLPDACTIAAHFFATKAAEILSWRAADYYWDTLAEPELRNRLLVTFAENVTYTITDPKPILRQVYRFREDFTRLPMIYHNSFVARALIERVRAKLGSYFFGSAPDVISGVVNAHFADRIALCSRPLSVVGVSHNSTGYRTIMGRERASRLAAQNDAFGGFRVHPKMVHSFHLPFVLGNELLVAKEVLFPHEAPELWHAGMLWQAAQTITTAPGDYDEVESTIRSLAAKNQVPMDRIWIPSRSAGRAAPQFCERELSPGVTTIIMDGRAAGLENIFDAAAWLERRMPAFTGKADLVAEPPRPQRISPRGGEPLALDFSATGNAAHFLGLGWSAVEEWGVWSIGTRAEVTLPLDPSFAGALRIRLQGRAFLPPVNPMLEIVVRADERPVGRIMVGCENSSFALDLDAIEVPPSRKGHEVNLTIHINTPVSPAKAGVSPDVREIGMGLERIVLSKSA